MDPELFGNVGILENNFDHPDCILHKAKSGNLPKLSRRASRFTRFRRKIFQLIIVSYQNEEARNYFRSFGKIGIEQRRQYYDKYWYIIHPFSQFTYYWRIIMVFVWMFLVPVDLWMITFRQCMRHMHMKLNRNFEYFVISMNLFLLFDILIRLLTGFVDSSKKLVTVPKKIFLNFIFNWWFVVDIYLVYFIIRNVLQIQTYSMLTPLVKLVRVTRIYTIFKDLQLFTKLIGLSKRTYIVISIVLFFLFCLHFNSCSICYTSQMLSDTYGNNIDETWLLKYQEEYTKNKQILRCHHMYLHALMDNMMMFNLGLLSTVNSSSHEEYFLWLYIMFVSYITKGVALIVIYFSFYYYYTIDIDNETLMKKTAEYVNLNVNREVGAQLLRYMSYKLEVHSIRPKLMKDLSKRIRRELCLELWKCEIEKTLLFKQLSEEVVEKITSTFELEIYVPHQRFYKADEIANCTYFLCSGKVAVFEKDYKELSHIVGSHYFGLSALYVHELEPLRSCTAVAIDYCEVIKIKRKDILSYAIRDKKFRVLLLFIAKFNNDKKYKHFT